MSEESIQERSGELRTEMKAADDGFLTDDFVRKLVNVGEIDILIGLPTHNDAKTVGTVVAAIQEGLLRWFPRDRAAIINADAGSRDGTPDLVVNASIDDVRRRSQSRFTLRTLHAISTQCGNAPPNGNALRTILAAAELLQARACVLISPESTQIKPDWMPALLQPIYKENCDIVLPTYARHKFDGLLITNLLYPMVRALYGYRIREPYAPEFAFSGRTGTEFLSHASWKDEAVCRGCEVSFTIAAITSGAQLRQSFLGTKPHLEHTAAELVPALRQTVGVLFSYLEPTFLKWSAVTGSQPVPTTGAEQQFTTDLLRINRKRLREMFSIGVRELESVLRSILKEPTLAELQKLAALAEEEFNYSTELWVKTVYEFAAAYRKSVISRDHIIQALAPLFRGRAFTFLVETRNSPASEVEAKIENLCLEFERLKPYLLEIWNGRE